MNTDATRRPNIRAPVFSGPRLITMVLAFSRLSSSISAQSAGIFCPPISQKKTTGTR